MALNKKIYSEASESVSAGKQITFNIPAYDSISQFFLEFTNNGAKATNTNITSSISRIRLLLDGETVVDLSAKELLDFYKILGSEVYQSVIAGEGNGVLPIYLSQLFYKLPEIEDSLSIGCDRFMNNRPLTNIQLQITCGATITDISNVAVYTERFNLGTGKNITLYYNKLNSYSQGISGVGESTVDTLPKDIRESYLALLVNANNGIISTGEVVVDGAPAIQKTPIAVLNSVNASRGYGTIGDSMALFFTDGGTKSALPMSGINDFRVKTTFTTAPTNNLYSIVASSIKQAQ